MKILIVCLLFACALALIEAQTCPTVTPTTCTGLGGEGRSQCNKNRACLGGTCKGVTGVPCSSDSHCYTNFKCVGCTCQHNGTTDTNAIIDQLWPSLAVPANTDCPMGRKQISMGDYTEKVQCEYPVSGGTQRRGITPGLEHAVCYHSSVPTPYFDVSKITCSARYGYACVNGRCINQCDTVTTLRPLCPQSAPGLCVASGGGQGVCLQEKNSPQYRCFPTQRLESCKYDNDCPLNMNCANCTCVSDSSNPYGYSNRCNTYDMDQILNKIYSCQTGGYGATCQTIPNGCSMNYVLGGVTYDSTIRTQIWNDIVSADAENFGDCGLARALSRYCPKP